MIFLNFLLWVVYLSVVIHFEQWIFIIYDPAGKERNNFEQPKINWKFISTNNSYWPYSYK